MITKKHIKSWILHIVVAIIAFILTLVFNEMIPNLGWFYVFAFFIATIAWEIRQKSWKYRKLDTIIDVLLANGVYVALMLRSTIL